MGFLGTFFPYFATGSETLDKPRSPARKARSIKLCTILEGPLLSLRMIVRGVTPRISANSLCVSPRVLRRFLSCSPVILRAWRIDKISAVDPLIHTVCARISDCCSVFNLSLGRWHPSGTVPTDFRISHNYLGLKGLDHEKAILTCNISQ